MEDYSSRKQPLLSPASCLFENAAGDGNDGVDRQLGFEPTPHSNTQGRPLPYRYDQQNENWQSLCQDPSPANIALFHNDRRYVSSAYADQLAWYRPQVFQNGTINPALLASTEGFQSHPVTYSQYSEQYLKIGGQFDQSTSLLVPASAEQDTPGCRKIANDDQYNPALDFDAEQVLDEPVELPAEVLSQVSDTFHTHPINSEVGRQEGMPMSAVLGRPPGQSMCNPVPDIVVKTLLHPGLFAFSPQDGLDLDARHNLQLPGSAPPSPASVVSGNALRCIHEGCTSEFNGVHRRGNLARHRRLKHRGQVVQYKCEDKDCKQSFMRQDARLNHYRKYHPGLANKSVVLHGPSTSNGTGSGRSCLDSSQKTYSITSRCDSGSVNDADTQPFFWGR